VLLAEGDSWFDYPGPDVLDYLEDVYRYDVESRAKAGHRAEDMAYADGQLDDLARTLEKLLRDEKPVRAILLSAGGNDLLGSEFGMLLEHVNSGLAPLNPQVVAGVIGLRVRTAYLHILTKITETAVRITGRAVPILIHGYAPPVPDGRGVLGGWWFLPGPWMAPGFRDKGLGDTQLARRKAILVELIGTFHQMLRELTTLAEFSHVHFVELDPETLSTGDDYKESWANELHPTKKGFELVAHRFAEVLAGI
jgi:lysophospholipase L1-like esterase